MPVKTLHALTTKQLMAILKHVQLGADHLSKILPEKVYKQFLRLGHLTNNQISKIESDRQEKVGNVSVVVNTILTSCFGAWLGFNAFSNSYLSFSAGFLIILAAIIFGLLTGYLGYLLTHYHAKLALQKQRLLNIEQLLIDIIIHKRKNKMDHLHRKIHQILVNLNIESKDELHSSQDLLKTLERLTLFNENHEISTIYKKIITRIKIIGMRLSALTSNKKSLLPEDLIEQSLQKNILSEEPYLKILISKESTDKPPIPKLKKWLFRNLSSILVGLIPTFLGTFASMFVFLNGIPAFFHGININFGFTESHTQFLKQAALFFALGVSIYFAYSHLHSNYNSFRRAKQLEGAEKVIAEKNNSMIELMTELNYWMRIYNHLILIEDLTLHFPSVLLTKQNPSMVTS